MDNRPIGVFDSGLGGLTGLKALRRLMPEEDFVFFADTGRMPYGPRPLPELRRIAVQDMEVLASYGVKAILAACGTISAAAHAELEAFPLPAFGVLRPAIEAMAAVPGTGPLVILATEASIRSAQFTEALREACPGREIVGLACPAFAPMIEAGHIDPDDPVVRENVAAALAPLERLRPDAVLLGCTHYGIIEDTIREYVGRAPLLSAAACGAEALREHLAARGLTGGGAGRMQFYISSAPEAFNAFAARYLGCGKVSAARLPVLEVPKP